MRTYVLLAVSLFCLAVGSRSLRAVIQHREFDFVGSDGRYYYVYLPSLVIDGNLDFANQMREHWGCDHDPELLEKKTERGFVKNKYPVGLALTLTPSFLCSHAISHVLHGVTGNRALAPDGYSLVYQLLNLFFLMALGCLSMCLIDRLLVERFRIDPRSTVLAILAYWVGSPFGYYYVQEPFMVHVISGFWVVSCAWLVHRMLSGMPGRTPSGWDVARLSFCFSMALVCRPTNFVFATLPGCCLLVAAQAGLLGRFLRLSPFALVGLLPLLVQASAWKVMTGHWISYSYDEEGFLWSHPALWQTLISSRHGLLFWTPLLFLSLVGLILKLYREARTIDPLLAAYLVSGLALWYCNSAWHCWWFGHAFGGRAFLELSGLFILGLAFCLEAARTSGAKAQRLAGASACLAVAFNIAMMALYVSQAIPRGDYLFHRDVNTTVSVNRFTSR